MGWPAYQRNMYVRNILYNECSSYAPNSTVSEVATTANPGALVIRFLKPLFHVWNLKLNTQFLGRAGAIISIVIATSIVCTRACPIRSWLLGPIEAAETSIPSSASYLGATLETQSFADWVAAKAVLAVGHARLVRTTCRLLSTKECATLGCGSWGGG